MPGLLSHALVSIVRVQPYSHGVVFVLRGTCVATSGVALTGPSRVTPQELLLESYGPRRTTLTLQGPVQVAMPLVTPSSS